MALLAGIPHTATIAAHRPWPRAAVVEDGWRQAVEQLATGSCTLLAMWGDPPHVHLALLGAQNDIAVISLEAKTGTYPSVAARHPPAVRLERAIQDLFGLEALGSPDRRPWLDLGFWDVRHPLGKMDAAGSPGPYAFLPVEGEALHQVPGGPVHAGTIEP